MANFSKAETRPQSELNERKFVNKKKRMDPVKILQRAWHILWNYRTLWAFGLILALAAGGTASSHGGNNGMQFRDDGHSNQIPQQSTQEFFNNFRQEMQKAFK